MRTVLVVEDQPDMQRVLERLLHADAMEVELAADGRSALKAFRSRVPSAVLLDLTLPDRCGRELCPEFKAMAPAVPVVVVSATTDVDQKVLLLELGADDFVTKPFSPKELMARLRRAMRRQSGGDGEAAAPAFEPDSDTLSFGDIQVNFATMETRKNGAPVAMTAQEYALVRVFGRSPGRVISREELLQEIGGTGDRSLRAIDTQIGRLRRKLEDDPTQPAHFVTVHRAGYKFVRGER